MPREDVLERMSQTLKLLLYAENYKSVYLEHGKITDMNALVRLISSSRNGGKSSICIFKFRHDYVATVAK